MILLLAPQLIFAADYKFTPRPYPGEWHWENNIIDGDPTKGLQNKTFQQSQAGNYHAQQFEKSILKNSYNTEFPNAKMVIKRQVRPASHLKPSNILKTLILGEGIYRLATNCSSLKSSYERLNNIAEINLTYEIKQLRNYEKENPLNIEERKYLQELLDYRDELRGKMSDLQKRWDASCKKTFTDHILFSDELFKN